jgi:ferric-dicitrate binding protein FerR (iron transport regulator)
MNSSDDFLFEKYIAGDCTEAEKLQILQWLTTSENNRKEWLKLRMVSIKRNYTYFSDREHVARAYEELRREQQKRKQLEQEITRKVTLRFIRYAASIILLIGLSGAFYQYITDWQYPQMVVETITGNEQVRQITLPDSSQVWLSAGSRIEYPKRFHKKERKVAVEGKVYFEIIQDMGRPFFVKTETYTVKVLGTSFEVNAIKYSQTSDVTLVEGQVEILDNNLKSLCELYPGQQFEINKVSHHFALREVDAELYVSWLGGKLEFDGLTFGEIAKVIERQYGVRIILDDGIAKEMKLVGSLSLQKDIYEMMKTMELVVPIKYHVQTNTIVYIQSK